MLGYLYRDNTSWAKPASFPGPSPLTLDHRCHRFTRRLLAVPCCHPGTHPSTFSGRSSSHQIFFLFLLPSQWKCPRSLIPLQAASRARLRARCWLASPPSPGGGKAKLRCAPRQPAIDRDGSYILGAAPAHGGKLVFTFVWAAAAQTRGSAGTV